MKTLASRFMESRGQPIELDGETIYASHKVVLNPGISALKVRRLASKPNVMSGLRIKIKNGSLLVNGQWLAEFTLWAHTSPPELEVIADARSSCELQLWHVWMVDGIVQAWVGEAGIKVYSVGGWTRLECSGGGRVADFSTLVVEIAGLPGKGMKD